MTSGCQHPGALPLFADWELVLLKDVMGLGYGRDRSLLAHHWDLARAVHGLIDASEGPAPEQEERQAPPRAGGPREHSTAQCRDAGEQPRGRSIQGGSGAEPQPLGPGYLLLRAQMVLMRVGTTPFLGWNSLVTYA